MESLQKECPDSQNTVEFIQVDLTSDKSIDTAVEEVKAKQGHLDVLINNAGTFGHALDGDLDGD